MEYGITQAVTGAKGFIEIEEKRYNLVKSSKNFLKEIYYIEDKFDLLIGNYLAYEKNLLDSAAEYMIYQDHDYHSLHSLTNTFHRHVINLLSACRLYVDQIPQHLKRIYPNNKTKNKFVQDVISREYDSSISYRLMDALRNYVQHRGYPIQSLVFDDKVISHTKPREIRVTITPNLKLSILKKDKKFKRKVLTDLEKFDEDINIKPIIREYISCFGKIHKKLREHLKDDFIYSLNNYRSVINEYKKEYNETNGIAIVCKEEDGTYPEFEHIFDELPRYIEGLQKKNRRLDKIYLSFVTGRK